MDGHALTGIATPVNETIGPESQYDVNSHMVASGEALGASGGLVPLPAANSPLLATSPERREAAARDVSRWNVINTALY